MVSPLPENERALELIARIRTSRADNQKTLQEFEKFQKEFRQFAASGEQVNQALEQQVKVLQQQQIAAAKARKEQEQLVKSQQQVATTGKLIKDSLDQLQRTRQLREIAKDAAELAAKTDDVRKGVLQLRGALSDFGDLSKQEIALVTREFDQLVNQMQSTNPQQRRNVGNQILRQAGTELRNLPAIPIPGTSISTETPARVLQSLGRLDVGLKELVVSGGLASAAIVGISLAIKNFEDTVRPVGDLLKNIAFGRAEAARLLATLDAEEFVQEVDQRQRDLDGLRAERDQLAADLQAQRAALALPSSTDTALAEGKTAFDTLLATIAGASGPILEQQERLDQLNTTITKHEETLAGLTQQYEEQRLAAEQLRIQRQQEANLDLVLQTRLSASSFQSVEAVDARVQQLERERQLIEETLGKYYLSEEAQTKYNQRLDELNLTLDVFNNEIRASAEAAEKAAEAEQKRQEAIDVVRGYDDEIVRLTEQRAQQEAAIYGRLNDNIIRITEQALEASERALKKLEERQEDLKRELDRDTRDTDLKARFESNEQEIKFQRDEQKQLRDHLRTLRKIREDADAQEFGLVRDRNFTALRDLRVSTNRRLNEENRNFIEQGQEREASFGDLVQDEKRRREFERESRIQRYKDALDDAQIAFDREDRQAKANRDKQLAAAGIAASREIGLLNSKYAQEQAMLYNSVRNELNLIAYRNAERLRLEEQFLFARAQLLQSGGLFGLLGALPGLIGSGGNSYTNAPQFNITTSGSSAQTNALLGLVENAVASAFNKFAKAR